MQEFRLLSTSGILGYGFPEASLAAGIERHPDMIGVDGGSVDPGPHYLGSGKPFCSTMAIRRDLRLMLRAAIAQRIPMVIGTCSAAPAASRTCSSSSIWCAKSPARRACTSRWR